MTIEAIGATQSVEGTTALLNLLGGNQPQQIQEPTSGFGEILSNMIGEMENKIDKANRLVRQFAVDDNVPVHQVTFALEEARLSVEMTVQMRARLVEGYREIMNMQM